MNRRSFLQATLGGMVAAAIAPLLPKLATPKLALRKDAFAIAMEPLEPPFTPPFETLRPGDMFTIEGRWVKNPVTGQTIHGLHQRFMVTAAVSSSDPIVPYWPSIDQPDTAIDRRRERLL